MSIGSIAGQYKLTFAGIAKHLDVLQHAGLIKKTRRGKEQIVSIEPLALAAAYDFFDNYKQLWEQRLDSLDNFLQVQTPQREKQ